MPLILTVKTTVSLGKRLYQTSLKIYGSLAFTNNVKGLHLFTIIKDSSIGGGAKIM